MKNLEPIVDKLSIPCSHYLSIKNNNTLYMIQYMVDNES